MADGQQEQYMMNITMDGYMAPPGSAAVTTKKYSSGVVEMDARGMILVLDVVS
jgi:hypothetical protein